MSEADDMLLKQIAESVERGYEMGGLSDGLYFDFASDVAKAYARQAVLLERERCAKLCEGLRNAAPSYFEINEYLDEAAAAIRAGSNHE